MLGVARRSAELRVDKAEWASADITSADLVPLFRGADAVVHLAWAIQPSHDGRQLRRINVDGSRRVLRAVGDAGVPALVYASSLGAYSPGPKDRRVDESWPTEGVPTSFYSRDKAQVERLLDDSEREAPDRRVVRIRPGLIFKRKAATGIRRLFAGPFVPSPLIRPDRVLAVPDLPRSGFRLSIPRTWGRPTGWPWSERPAGRSTSLPSRSSTHRLSRLIGARLVPRSEGAARLLIAMIWRLHLQPTPPGWLDLAVSAPLMDVSRAEAVLGWKPQLGADQALLELMDGMSEETDADTPPLSRKTSGPLRLRELLTGLGRASGEAHRD